MGIISQAKGQSLEHKYLISEVKSCGLAFFMFINAAESLWFYGN